MDDSYLKAALGGVLIGLATVTLLLGSGRIAGISGIFASAVLGRPGLERILFLAGLLAAALIGRVAGWFDPAALLAAPLWGKTLLAGLLVGVGTQLGSGCTSGHGVCGIANLSGRGIVATLTFMAVAALVVAAGAGGLQ